MSSILNIAVSGLNDAVTRVANATSNIVNAVSTNFQPKDVVTLSNSVVGHNLGVRSILVPRPQGPQVNTTPPAAPTPTTYAPVPTTSASVVANLPASASVGFSSSPVSIPVFDGLGALQNLALTFTKTGTNSFNVNVSSPNGASTTTGDFSIDVPVTFNGITNQGTLASIGSGAGYTANGGQIQFDLNYPGAGSQTVTLSFGNLNSSTGLTQFAGTDVTLYSKAQNGSAYGPIEQPITTSSQAFGAENGVDLAAEIVALNLAKISYAANVKTIKTANELQKTLIDIKT